MEKDLANLFPGLVLDGPLPAKGACLLSTNDANELYDRLDVVMSQALPDKYKAPGLRICAEELFHKMMLRQDILPSYHIEQIDKDGEKKVSDKFESQFFRIYFIVYKCFKMEELFDELHEVNNMFNTLMHPSMGYRRPINLRKALSVLARTVWAFSAQPIPPRITSRYKPMSLVPYIDHPLQVMMMMQITGNTFSSLRQSCNMLQTLDNYVGRLRYKMQVKQRGVWKPGLTFTLATYGISIYSRPYNGGGGELFVSDIQKNLTATLEQAFSAVERARIENDHTPILVWTAFTLPDCDDVRTATSIINELRRDNRMLLTAVALTDEALLRFNELLENPDVMRVNPDKFDIFISNLLEKISSKYERK
jgi:hypothetical protein